MIVTEYHSPLGRILLAQEGEAISGLWFEGQKYFPNLQDAEFRETELLAQAKRWLDRYFAGKQPPVTELPLAPAGSEFRQQVWQILLRIPYGQTTTYAAISREVASMRGLEHMSAQAVGGAIGHNPISILIPCHRAVGSDGSLTGYAGGLARKEWLLKHEQTPTQPE